MLSRNSVFSQMYYQPAGPDCQNPHKMGTVVNWKGLATVRAAARVLIRDSLLPSGVLFSAMPPSAP
jgi:hypothetical protein